MSALLKKYIFHQNDSFLFIVKVGRLPLLVASNLFMTLALAAFGTFIYAQGGALDQVNSSVDNSQFYLLMWHGIGLRF